MLSLRFTKILSVAGLFACFGFAQAQTLVTSFTWLDNGHTYDLYHTAGISYTDAAIFAASKGGTLATIVTANENTAVTTNLGGSIDSTAYLGASQPVNETDVNANWTWITGETWSYTPWASGEPNDFSGPASEQNLEIYGNGTWNDIGDNLVGYNHDLIVETVPEPSLMVAGFALLVGIAKRRRA